WTVLFREMTSSRPLAEEVAELRGRIATAVRRMVDDAVPSPARLPPHASDAIAHAIVGAGESLANWWLEHPDVRLEEVADRFAGAYGQVRAGGGQICAYGAGFARTGPDPAAARPEPLRRRPQQGRHIPALTNNFFLSRASKSRCAA